MGDLMFYLRNPRVDRGAGASIKNWIVTLESVAKDNPADTIYIAGHSKVNLPLNVTRADLLKFRDYFSGLLAYVQKGIASGRSGGRDREGRERAGIRRLRGQPRRHDPGRLRGAHSEGMRVFGALLVVISIGLSIGAAQVHGQEPRLPAPAATPSESEALIQRALALSAAGNYRESAATWQTVGAREPVHRESRDARIDTRTDRRR